jgi:hypothetical protein
MNALKSGWRMELRRRWTHPALLIVLGDVYRAYAKLRGYLLCGDVEHPVGHGEAVGQAPHLQLDHLHLAHLWWEVQHAIDVC